MIIVDRISFMAWLEGYLIYRCPNGTVIVGDDAAHARAEDRLEAGETIGLTDGGELVSTMREINGAWVEEPLTTTSDDE